MICKNCKNKTFNFDRTISVFEDENGNIIEQGMGYYCDGCGTRYEENCEMNTNKRDEFLKEFYELIKKYDVEFCCNDFDNHIYVEFNNYEWLEVCFLNNINEHSFVFEGIKNEIS